MIKLSKKTTVFHLVVITLLSGCGSPEINTSQAVMVTQLDPHEIYLSYQRDVKNGASDRETQKYFSDRRNKLSDKSVENWLAGNPKLTKDVIDQKLSEISRNMANCLDLVLVEKRVEENGQKAFLTFNTTDTCEGDEFIERGKKITLVQESGWKIDVNETVIVGRSR